MNYSVLVLPAAQKDLDRLEMKIYKRCYEAMMGLTANPRSHGAEKLVGEDGFRIRVGDWRIVFRIDDSQKKIFIYRVKHRREVYR